MKRLFDYFFLEPSKRIKCIEAMTCPITLAIMVDPVVAADGNSYEREAILKWIRIRKTSPLIPSMFLSATTLVTNRHLATVIENAVDSGDVKPADVDEWRKIKANRRNAESLFNDGQIIEAAALGLPEAQGVMAKRAYEIRDYTASMHWAELAADVCEPIGSFYLAYAFFTGRGQQIDWEVALTYFQRIHQHVHCTRYICHIYKFGGHGVEKNDRELFNWAKRGQSEHAENCLQLGLCYYNGIGVEQNHVFARKVWFLCSHHEALYFRGKMLIKGEGGDLNRVAGLQCIEEAAKKGNNDSICYLKSMAAI